MNDVEKHFSFLLFSVIVSARAGTTQPRYLIRCNLLSSEPTPIFLTIFHVYILLSIASSLLVFRSIANVNNKYLHLFRPTEFVVMSAPSITYYNCISYFFLLLIVIAIG